jgi:hypothetical protein
MSSKFDERAKRRIQELIDLGEEVKSSFRMTPHRVLVPDSTLYEKWRTASLNFLATALGKDTVHYNAFVEVDQEYSGSESRALHFLGVLHAAKDDITSGWVGRRDLLLTADAFEGFLEQAEYLLSQDYKDAAAVLVGGVLEATLRKICGVRQMEIGPREKIGTLNDKLAKHADPPAYSSMDHKQIITWAELRDNAAHAHYDRYDEQNVADMLKWVRDFAARHLA